MSHSDNTTHGQATQQPGLGGGSSNRLLSFLMRQTGLQVAWLMGMGVVLSLTAWSIYKGLYSSVGSIGGTVMLTFVLMLVLFTLSYFSAKFLSEKSIISGVVTFGFLAGLVLFLSYFSFSYWYGVFGENSGWVERDARIAVGEYYEFNEEILATAEKTYENHQQDFRENPAILALVTDMTLAQDTVSNLPETSQGEQTLETALNTSLEAEMTRLEGIIDDTPTEVTRLNDQLQDDKLAVLELERSAIKSIEDAELFALRDALNRSIDLEHRNRSTSEIRGGARRVGDPDFARITLHKANALLDLDINPDACGTLPSEEERAAPDYKWVERSFGKGSGGGGVCTRQLDKLLSEIEQYRTDLATYREAKQNADAKVQGLERQIEQMQQAANQATVDLEDVQNRLANPGEIKVRLVDLVTKFAAQPSNDALAQLRTHCDFVKRTAGSVPALAGSVGQMSCEDAGVDSALSTVVQHETSFATVAEACTGPEIKRKRDSYINGDFSGTQPEVAAKLQQTFGLMTTDIVEPCIAAALAFKTDTAEIETKASTFVRNEGALDQISTAATRFRGLLDRTEQNVASYTIWGGVIFLELAFFIFKFFYNRVDTRPEIQLKPKSNFTPRLAGIIRKLGQADDRGDFQIDQEELEAKGGDVRREIEDLLEDLYDRKEAVRPYGAFGPKILKIAYKEMRDALSVESLEEPIELLNPPRPRPRKDEADPQTPVVADEMQPVQRKSKKRLELTRETHQSSNVLGFNDPGGLVDGIGKRSKQSYNPNGKVHERNPLFMDIVLSDD